MVWPIDGCFIYLPQEKNYNKVHYRYMYRKKKQAKYRITTKPGMEIRGVDKRSLSIKIMTVT